MKKVALCSIVCLGTAYRFRPCGHSKQLERKIDLNKLKDKDIRECNYCSTIATVKCLKTNPVHFNIECESRHIDEYVDKNRFTLYFF